MNILLGTGPGGCHETLHKEHTLMLRKLLVLVVLLVGTGILLADECKGKVKKFEKGSITVTVGDKDSTFKIGKETKVFVGADEQKGKDKGKALKGIKEGDEVTVVHDKDKDDAKELKLK
jgi:chromosome condensin MukBEF MukE localization factor